MSFCPKCKYEYNQDVKKCPDCNIDLISKLPDHEEAENISFVPLPDLPGRIYAEMVKGAFEESGISCYIRSDGVLDAFGISGTGPVSKGFRLFVPENRLKECLKILQQMMNHI